MTFVSGALTLGALGAQAGSQRRQQPAQKQCPRDQMHENHRRPRAHLEGPNVTAVGTLDWLWPEAEAVGVPIAMMAGLFLPKFRTIAEKFPRLKLVIDHCGLNRHGQDDAAFIHLDELVKTAKLPNVALKATGAPHY